jgi:hypothetical protein
VSPRSDLTKLEELNIKIRGRWSAEDMAIFLRDLSLLYDVRRAIDLEPDLWRYARRYGPFPFSPGFEQWWGWPPRSIDSGLQVRRIEFASPGYIDLRGVADVVKQMRLLLKDLISISIKETRREKRLKNDSREQDVQAKLIANARNYVRLRGEAREHELDEDIVVRRVVTEIEGAQERILRQIERGNIKAIGPGAKEPSEDK